MAKSFRKPAVTEAEIERRNKAVSLCQSITYKGHMTRKDVAARIGVDKASLSSWTTGASVVPEYVLDRLAELDKKVTDAYKGDESNPKERIKKFISYRGLSIAAFERVTELSAGYVASMGKDVFDSTIGKISRVFPDLNTDWLRTGEGEMLNGYSAIAAAEKDAKMRVVQLEAENKSLREEIELLRRQNTRLIEKVLDKEDEQ